MLIRSITVFLVGILIICDLHSQVISPNGYSGLGIIPSASTIKAGQAIFSFDQTVPGTPISSGFNSQIGFGLTENLELVGRLATNDLKCNMFKDGECPSSTYRDFSSSIKWSLPIDFLKENKAAVAIGVTDFGGAATFFRSYYVVGTKSVGEFDISLGRASAKVPTSILDGTFASLTWKPVNWSNLSVQKVGQNSSAHALFETPLFNSGSNAWLTLNHRLSDASVMSKKWIGWGVSIPLDQTQSKTNSSLYISAQSQSTKKPLEKLTPSKLIDALIDKGFYKVKAGIKSNGILVLELENTSYLWNVLDAAGVALGVVSGAYASELKEQEFELTISSKGIKQIKVLGEARCVGLWLSTGEVCSKLSVQSLLQRNSDTDLLSFNLTKVLEGFDDPVNWSTAVSWSFRPEMIASPVLISTIGTEYGALDFDLGANMNVVLPLWAGASLETNRVVPLGLGTRQFEQGGVFFGSRLKGVTNRTLFHQLFNFAAINTQARFSAGTAYSVWEGKQIETSSQSGDGRYKFGYTGGSFKDGSKDVSSVSVHKREYGLFNFRYANNDQQSSQTEVTYGKFWAGDKGVSLNQRFWYGDSTLNVYFRRTRMTDSQPLVSFAGVQLSIPFTPRENKSFEHFGFRGVSQWTYSLETKVLEKDNIITGGYGEVPRVGDSLVMTLNRDRNSSRYYDTNIGRMRNAYLILGNN